MGKRHLSKAELLRKIKDTQMLKKSSDKSPFTGLATICNYTLWKEEKWYQKKLAEYNQAVLEYHNNLDAGTVSLEDMSERLWNKADFKVEYVPYTEADIRVSRKNSFLYEMEKKTMEANNTINEMSTRYLLIHFNVLMDMGYGKTRLERNKDAINKWLTTLTEADGVGVMDLHKELAEDAGIYVEMPNFR